VPLYRGLFRYFPDALAAVAELSRIGNEQHNPGSEMHWDRSKSGDELDSMLRHTLDAGVEDTDKVLHDTKIAWRALANLQKVLEKRNVQHLNTYIQPNTLSQYDPWRTTAQELVENTK
jgi:hypothetical protein